MEKDMSWLVIHPSGAGNGQQDSHDPPYRKLKCKEGLQPCWYVQSAP